MPFSRIGMQFYTAKHVANHFLKKHGKSGITQLKIQKLVYIAHGWHMAFHDDPLVANEEPEAWEFGPVFPTLYHEFKYRRSLPIIDLATEIDEDFKHFTPRIDGSDTRTQAILGKIWEVYGDRSGMALSTLCHEPGSPWAETREQFPGIRNANISNDRIKRHYKAKMARQEPEHA